MEGKLTVYFDDPFWVGVYERQDEAGYSVARVVFGSEPLDAEVYAFILHQADAFKFGNPQQDEQIEKAEKNFKRLQREVHKSMQQVGVGTKAQQAMKVSLTDAKQEREKRSHVEKEREAQERFRERQQKRKEKHRGH